MEDGTSVLVFISITDFFSSPIFWFIIARKVESKKKKNSQDAVSLIRIVSVECHALNL